MASVKYNYSTVHTHCPPVYGTMFGSLESPYAALQRLTVALPPEALVSHRACYSIT